MASRKAAIAAARARIRELKAAMAQAAALRKAKTDAIAPLRRRKDALTKRQAQMLILTAAGGTPNARGGGIRLTSVAEIHLNYSQRASRKPKQLAEDLLSGSEKIAGHGYGTTYTLRGWLRRGHSITKAQFRPVQKAIAARKRAEAALDRAYKAEAAAYQAAFDAGEKLNEVAIAAAVAQRLALWLEVDYTQDEHEVLREADNAEREIQIIEGQHLPFLQSDAPADAVCPCPFCSRDRIDAKKRHDEEARLDALPTKMQDCPLDDGKHGRHRVSIETRKVRFTDQLRALFVAKVPAIEPLLPPKVERYGWLEDPDAEVPIAWCRKGKEPIAFYRANDWLPELQKAVKAAAKEKAALEREQKKADRALRQRLAQPVVVTLTPGATEGDLDFICPSCREQVPFEAQRGDGDEADPDEVWVECPMCGYEGDPDVVKTVARKAAA